MGSTFSAIVGFVGMNMAVEGNVRVASASRVSYSEALKIAYRSGTITGMLTDGLGLLGGTLIFIIFGEASPDVLLGFGFGGTLLALFMRVGGGIYTKAADVGADLVGKVEAGMEEDDPRNAAVIADLVGDNVGDCAGMAADIFESYEVTVVASLILGLALNAITGQLVWIIVPLLIRGVGVISSIIGTYAVSLWKDTDAEEAMFKSYELSSAITITAAFLISYFYAGDLRMGVLNAIGVALAVIFNPLTAYATSSQSKRVQQDRCSIPLRPGPGDPGRYEPRLSLQRLGCDRHRGRPGRINPDLLDCPAGSTLAIIVLYAGIAIAVIGRYQASHQQEILGGWTDLRYVDARAGFLPVQHVPAGRRRCPPRIFRGRQGLL